MSTLQIIDLKVNVADKEILKGVNLTISTNEVHAVMGPNGTGKSTLSQAIMGHPDYQIVGGQVLLDGEDLLALDVDERARLGLFMAVQYPSEVSGITNSNLLRTAINARRPQDDPLPIFDFIDRLDQKMALLDMPEAMAERYVNEGFSGGEKKRNEILQMLMIEPKFALLDEIDSGLDIDALQVVAKGINSMRGQDFGALIITHYQRLLNYVQPDFVHIMKDGRIVKSGGPELALELEAKGYKEISSALASNSEEE